MATRTQKGLMLIKMLQGIVKLSVILPVAELLRGAGPALTDQD